MTRKQMKKVFFVEEINEENLEVMFSYWMEGNNSCDCNRKILLQRALGNDLAWDDDTVKCGDSKIKIIEAYIDDKPVLEWLDE